MSTIHLPCPSFSPQNRKVVKENLVFNSSVHLPRSHGGTRAMFRSKRDMVPDSVSSKQWAIMSWGSSNNHPSTTNFHPSHVSPSDTVEQFYNCINSKNWKQLGDFITDNCCFEDYTFPRPFDGKKEVLEFFQQLTEGMGKNLKFVTQNMCIGDNKSTIATMWHLEWKDKQIPFTRGCSFYECTKQNDKFLIKHARVVIESPIKPGALALTLLKFVTNLFDEFPTATERFLQRPYVILQFLIKVYHIFVEPFIHPLMSCYINLWKVLVQLLSYALNILFHISRIFFN